VKEASLMRKIHQQVTGKQYFVQVHGIVRGSIDNPLLCKTFQISVGEEAIGIVMDLIDGQKLDELLHPHDVAVHSNLKMVSRVKICTQIAFALSELHAINVVHGDLKPENILIKNIEHENMQILLVDFGLSDQGETNHRNMGQSTLRFTKSSGKSGFTPLYCAPELLLFDEEAGLFPVPTRSSDVYSMSLIIYEVILFVLFSASNYRFFLNFRY
jgi:serine/threonine protein kinase